MENVTKADIKKMNEDLKLTKQLSRIDVKVFKIIEKFAELKPGRSLVVRTWDGLSVPQVYRKLYFVRTKIAPKIVKSLLLADETYLQYIMTEFLEWRQNECEGYLVLHKPADDSTKSDIEGDDDSDKIAAIRMLHKEAGKKVKKIEKEMEAEERGALLMSIQEQMVEEEASNLELPPSAGKTEGDDDVIGGDDWLAALMGKK